MSRLIRWYVLLWAGVALVVAGCAAPAAVTLEPESSLLPGSAWHHYWRVHGGLSEVRDLAVGDEWLWVATSRDLVRLNQRTLTCDQFSHTSTSPGVPLDRVCTLLVDDQGRLWAGGGHGLVRYDEESGWVVIYTDGYVHSFARDIGGDVWIFFSDRYGKKSALLFQDQETPAGGSWKPEHITEEIPGWDDCEAWQFMATSELKYNSLAECAASSWEVVEDAGGARWSVVCYGESCSILRDSETVWTIPMTHDVVQAIVAAGVKDGVWLGTDEGLFYSDGRTVQQYLPVAGRLVPRGPAVHSLAVTGDGHVWISTSEGLLRFDEEGGGWQPVARGEEGIVIERDVPIAPDGQAGLWALHSGDLLHLDGRTWRFWPLPVEIRSCETHAVAEFHGEVWVAAGECGLWRFDGQAWDRPPLNIKALALVQGRDGKLYVQESESSPYVYDGEKWTRLPEQGWEDLYAPALPPTPAPAGTSLEGQEVPVLITVDAEGNIWGASGTHIWRHSPDGEWTNVLQLPNDSRVTQLFGDSQGRLWVGGRRRLVHYDGEYWEDVSIRDDTHILFYVTALAQDQQGRIWVGGRNGLSVYDPAAGE